MTNQEDKETAQTYLKNYLDKINIDASYNVVVNSEPFEGIRQHSAGADLLFLGLRSRGEEEDMNDYANYYVEILRKTKNFPPTAFVVAAEEIKFNAIFNQK